MRLLCIFGSSVFVDSRARDLFQGTRSVLAVSNGDTARCLFSGIAQLWHQVITKASVAGGGVVGAYQDLCPFCSVLVFALVFCR